MVPRRKLWICELLTFGTCETNNCRNSKAWDFLQAHVDGTRPKTMEGVSSGERQPTYPSSNLSCVEDTSGKSKILVPLPSSSLYRHVAFNMKLNSFSIHLNYKYTLVVLSTTITDEANRDHGSSNYKLLLWTCWELKLQKPIT